MTTSRSWWLAPPGLLRRFQATLLLMFALAVIMVAGWAVATTLGARSSDAWGVGVVVALAVEIALFAVRMRVRSERSLVLPGLPSDVYAIATDPMALQRRSPMNLTVTNARGEPGRVGSSFRAATTSGLVIRARVLEADPPSRIVIETRTRLSRTIIERRYTPCQSGTEVQVRSEQRMPLWAWLLRPLYAREVRAVLAESERALRQAVIDRQGRADTI
jgi:hypothetical protein